MSERFTLENPNLGMNRKTSGRIGLRRLRNDSAIIGHDRIKTVDRAMSFELSNINSITIELSSKLVCTFHRFSEEL